MKMESFYKPLIKESLNTEDVEQFEKEKKKTTHELRQLFYRSSSCYHSYLYRTLFQILLSTLIILLLVKLFDYPFTDEFFDCVIYKYKYHCVLPVSVFYKMVHLLSVSVVGAYILFNFINFIWLICPIVDRFYALMYSSRRFFNSKVRMELEVLETVDKPFTKRFPDIRDASIFFDLYFNDKSRDIGLLTTLLAGRNGIAEGLRILSLCDREYRLLWHPLETLLECVETERSVYECRMEWTDAPIAHFFEVKYRDKFKIQYTLEIIPTNGDEPYKVVDYVNGHWESTNKFSPGYFKYSSQFVNVKITDEDENEIKLLLSTELNGRTIAQKSFKVFIPPKDEKYDQTSYMEVQETESKFGSVVRFTPMPTPLDESSADLPDSSSQKSAFFNDILKQ